MGGTSGTGVNANQWAAQNLVPYMGSTNPRVGIADAINAMRRYQPQALEGVPLFGNSPYEMARNRRGRGMVAQPLSPTRMA